MQFTVKKHWRRVSGVPWVPNVCSVCVSPWSGRLMLLLVLDYTLVSRLKTVIDAATEPHTKTQFPIKSQIFKIVLEISSWSHFSYNFTLNNFSKACIPVKWIFSEFCDLWYLHELLMGQMVEASDQKIQDFNDCPTE